MKNNGKVRVCIDFRNLNDACSKDDFQVPITNVMIKITYSFERMSFMDDFSKYNQTKMCLEDEKHASFQTPQEAY